jgi:hypothetical protein
MMCLFSGMALSPTWSCSEGVFADAVDYGKMHYRLDEDLNSSWVESPLCPSSFGVFPACPATARSVFFSEDVIMHEFDLESEGGTVTRQTSSAGDKSENKGKIGVPDPIGVRERTMCLLAHAHARAKGMELAGCHGKMCPAPWDDEFEDEPLEGSVPHLNEGRNPILIWGKVSVMKLVEPEDGFAGFGRTYIGFKYRSVLLSIEEARGLPVTVGIVTSIGVIRTNAVWRLLLLLLRKRSSPRTAAVLPWFRSRSGRSVAAVLPRSLHPQ